MGRGLEPATALAADAVKQAHRLSPQAVRHVAAVVAHPQQHGGCAQVLHQLADVVGPLCALGGIGQGHQVEHLDAVAADLVAQAALHAARHLLLDFDGQGEQLHSGAVDGQVGV